VGDVIILEVVILDGIQKVGLYNAILEKRNHLDERVHENRSVLR
jgi:hypothetical protein